MKNLTPMPSPNNARILVVDDEPRLVTSLKQLLNSHQYEVDTALGGKAACEQLIRQKYELVLLDLNMGDMDGHQVMGFMAENSIDAATIVVSGESTFSAVSKALRRGAYDYLKKPYDPEELVATVESALSKKLLESAHGAMQRRLQRSEELHRYIVNSSPDIVFMLDKEGKFTFLNNKIEKILGFKKRELLGQKYTAIIAENELKKARYLFQQNTAVNKGIRNFEMHLKSSDSNRPDRFFDITIFPIERKTGKSFNAEGQSLNPTFIGTYGTARDITERKEAEDFINFQAYHDLLTRLPNRSLFKDRLNLAIAQAKRNSERLAVMFLDLDRFKVVNDTLGHAMGDRLLQAVSARLEGCLREGDTLSRFGGDEFTLLLPEINSREDARKIAKKLIQELKEPFKLGDHDVFIGVSIGIAMYPEGGISVEQIIQNADVAMYHVKSRGKDGYQFFVSSMNTPSSNRLILERDLRKALEDDQLKVYYQPQVNAQSGEIIGVEALVRWHHPEKGVLSPSQFLPLAEETKLIVDISNWVLKTACNEVKKWFQEGYHNIRLAVNFSPKQIEHPRFVQALIAQLKRYDFPAEKLEIELTENVIMNDLENMVKTLSMLAENKITIAIDDFGTGYSSLSYLHTLPIHTLKVDQSFVKNIQEKRNEACIVNAIVAMAQGLKLNIVAEGVETETQLKYLKALGCQEVQGFYFGRPQPAEYILTMLAEHKNSQQKNQYEAV